jgi:phage tail protein X
MRRLTRLLLPLLPAVVALSACATGAAQRDAERLALYRSHAGDPVDSILYTNSNNGWTPLGEGAFALWTAPSKAWLVQLYPPCNELDYADRIAFRDPMGRLSAKFDRVMVANHGLMPISCTIQEIRPLDIKAIRTAERDMRAKRQVEAAPPAAASASGGAGGE